MAISAVPVDDTRLSRIDRWALKTESTLNLASGIVIFALVCLAATNVLGRKLLNLPVPGFIDWVEQFMAFFVFAGLAFCQREGGHIRMEIAIGRMRGRSLWIVEFLSILFMILLTTVLVYGTWSHFLRSFDFCVSELEPGQFDRSRTAALAGQADRSCCHDHAVGAACTPALGVRPRDSPQSGGSGGGAADTGCRLTGSPRGRYGHGRRWLIYLTSRPCWRDTTRSRLPLWLSGLLLVLVVLGVRVAFAAAFIGFLGLCLFFMQKQGFERGLITATKLSRQIPHSKSTTYALSLIPTFILIGYLAYFAGLTRYLFEAAKRWFGWLPGGLGVATVFATADVLPPYRGRRSQLRRYLPG